MPSFADSFWFSKRPKLTHRIVRPLGLDADADALLRATTPSTTNSIPSASYSVLTFFPKTLYDQFRRLANVYFLVLAVLMLIPLYKPNWYDSPLLPWTTLLPLAVIVSLSLIKELVEDAKRHAADRRVNDRRVSVLDAVDPRAVDDLCERRWSDLRPGDLVVLGENELVPADVVVMCTSEKNDVCFVETSNIDGETNLKQRRGVLPKRKRGDSFRDDATTSRRLARLREFEKLKCELPNGRVHSFSGAAHEKNHTRTAVSIRNVLLRGSVCKNATWATCMVVFVGAESKVAQNAKPSRVKLSNVERTMNVLMRSIFIFLFCLVSFSAALEEFYRSSRFSTLTYLFGAGNEYVLPRYFALFLTFVITYNNCVPMSLYVTVEMVNYVQAWFISQDVEMYCSTRDERANASTSNLNSDLGQVEYVFSDKTGTLTQNIMKLRAVFVGSTIYGSSLDSTDEDALACDVQNVSDEHTKRELKEFLTACATTHTVQREAFVGDPFEASIAYRAESPDERALCEGAANLGVVFLNRSSNGVVSVLHKPIDLPESASDVLLPELKRKTTSTTTIENVESFEQLAVNEFDSNRKRMSCLFRVNKKRYVLYAKGADSSMLPEVPVVRPEKMDVRTALSTFASEGLRTLVVGKRELTSDEATEWLERHYEPATTAIKDRAAKLSDAASRIERDFEILGCTALEDKLQEGVPDTLETLRACGIKVWVLTGDKLETAINIGFSSKLLDDRMTLVKISSSNLQDLRDQLTYLRISFASRSSDQTVAGSSKRRLKRWATSVERWSETTDDVERPIVREDSSRGGLALAVTGDALEIILQDDGKNKCRQDFLAVALNASAVLCTRVSPAQKAACVALIKKGAPSSSALASSPCTLAIGDGANDVPMIQEAQIGVGISGLEGTQALNASDFSIAQFRFLKRLLLVHGRWSYRRMSKVVLYSLYKNLVLTLTLFYMQFYCRSSGTVLYEGMIQSGFNFFLGWPPFMMGVFDREISARFALKNPQLYASGRRNLNLNPLKLGWRVFEALVHSLIVFFIPYAAAVSSGASDLSSFGLQVYTALICVCQYKVVFESSTTTSYSFYLWALSLVFYFAFAQAYSSVYSFSPTFYGVAEVVFSSSTTWHVVALSTVSCFAIDTMLKMSRLQFIPHPVDILVERDRIALAMSALHERRKRKREAVVRRIREDERLREANDEDAHADIDAIVSALEQRRELPDASVSHLTSLLSDLDESDFDYVDPLRRRRQRPIWRRMANALLPPSQDTELLQNLPRFTESEVRQMGIESPSFRSSFDFAQPQ